MGAQGEIDPAVMALLEGDEDNEEEEKGQEDGDMERGKVGQYVTKK